jgi:hypothetical protein
VKTIRVELSASFAQQKHERLQRLEEGKPDCDKHTGTGCRRLIRPPHCSYKSVALCAPLTVSAYLQLSHPSLINLPLPERSPAYTQQHDRNECGLHDLHCGEDEKDTVCRRARNLLHVVQGGGRPLNSRSAADCRAAWWEMVGPVWCTTTCCPLRTSQRVASPLSFTTNWAMGQRIEPYQDVADEKPQAIFTRSRQAC